MLFNRDKDKVKLCDFGVSNKLDKTYQTQAAMAGSLRFMSPEQYSDKLTYKIDVWALGCLML